MYTGFYQLREEPFRLTPDPRFLHLAEPHRAALTALLQGVLLRKGFLVLTGPIGTGKTTLLHALLQILSAKSLIRNQVVSAFLVNPSFTREEFLEAILEEFEIPHSGTSKPRRLAALHHALVEVQHKNGTAVLIVDEAHLLPIELMEEIRLLSNLDTYQEKPLQIILSGQPELEERLRSPHLAALQQRIASRAQLRALSPAELRSYVRDRLLAAGLRGNLPFAGQSLEAVQFYTRGVPRLINLLCDASLTLGAQVQLRQIEPHVIEEAAHKLGLLEGVLPESLPAADGGAAKPAPYKNQSDLVTASIPRSTLEILIEALKEGRALARG